MALDDKKLFAKMEKIGNGRLDTLIGADPLRDGTYLVYEKQEIPGEDGGVARACRLDPSDRDYGVGAISNYTNEESEQEIIKPLNKLMFIE